MSCFQLPQKRKFFFLYLAQLDDTRRTVALATEAHKETCEILSLKLAIELLLATSEEEKHFLYIAQLDETRCTTALVVGAHKKCVKAQYDQSVNPLIYS